MPTELQVIAADNRNKYADFPRRRRIEKELYHHDWWLVWAFVFYNNAWQRVLWEIRPKKIRHRRVHGDLGISFQGRCLTPVEWALLYDVNPERLGEHLRRGKQLSKALEDLQGSGFHPRNKIVNLYFPKLF